MSLKMQLKCATLAWLLLGGSLATAAKDGYRLAGLAGSTSNPMAFIELPNGDSHLFRTGDEKFGLKVIEIAEKQVRILVDNKREVILKITGAGSASPAEPITNSVGAKINLDVNTVQEMQETAEKHTSGNLSQTVGIQKQINSTLGLPPDIRMTEVNGKEITSEEELLNVLLSNYRQGKISRVITQKEEGVEVEVSGHIYLMPSQN